ncbi:MAG TPA: nucleotidyl transferase AbiEii/AbiGii toxin family protein [Thermoanaerobaculia bacterium]|nr:nucleotidyl transferase AbiEii/AbiGii toxin family protein [Thermoanaerobaculia bacterium]
MSLSALRDRAIDEGLPLGTVASEALHILLLDALFAHPGSAIMAFQGGTCLHLVHGSYRYSEDLDLAGRELDATAARRILERARPEVEKLAVQVFGAGEHAWKTPGRPGRLSAYWYHFTPDATRQRIRVKVEFASFPTYEPAVLPVRSELDLLRRRPLVGALQAHELLAEKVAAVLGRRYLKGRDLFDLWYLDAVLQTPLDDELLRRKLVDYGVALSRERVEARIAAAGAADLEAEMDRFLPQRHRAQLGGGGYDVVKRLAYGVLERAVRAAGLS